MEEREMMKDFTKRQFDQACIRWGFTPELMGYYNVGNGVCVNVLNAGDKRRDRLDYLIRESKKAWGRSL
jgi:hypothetical protein